MKIIIKKNGTNQWQELNNVTSFNYGYFVKNDRLDLRVVTKGGLVSYYIDTDVVFAEKERELPNPHKVVAEAQRYSNITVNENYVVTPEERKTIARAILILEGILEFH